MRGCSGRNKGTAAFGVIYAMPALPIGTRLATTPGPVWIAQAVLRKG